MKQFFKFLFASIFGFLIGGFLLILILAGILGALAGSGEESGGKIAEHSVLHMQLSYLIPDRTAKSPFLNLPLPGLSGDRPMGLNEILSTLRKAKDNSSIDGILLGADISPNSYANLEEIRNALLDFKKSGKFIIAYGEMMDEHSYYVASVSDKVYLHPSGELFMKGLSSQTVYLKTALEKLGLEPVLIRHGKFKAAGEPLIADHMSNENRAQVEAYVGSLYQTLLAKVAESRKMPKEKLQEIVEQLKVRAAEDAVTHHLVDGLKYADEVYADINVRCGKKKEDKVTLISMKRMRDETSTPEVNKDKIAVVYCVGDIVSGSGSDDMIGSDRYAETLEKIRRNDAYKAVVLRINSPGGSALASDVIWREVELLKKAGKPVIVSMGSVAASGGYYIGCGADAILAQPNTITGSIGVFGLFLNASELLNNKLGVHVETVKFGEYADLGSPDRPMTASEKEVLQQTIDKVYHDFISRVAQGRKLTLAQVDSLAQGRVWSGADAKKMGLIDGFGGLPRAIELAAKKADLSGYAVEEMPEMKDPLEELFSGFSASIKEKWLKEELGPVGGNYEQLKRALRYQGIQMRMLQEIKVD